MKFKRFKIADTDFRDQVRKSFKDDFGVYVLYWFQGHNPRPICRLLNTDDDGILYIGKTDGPLHKRVGKDLQESLLANQNHLQSEPNLKGYNTLSQKFYRVRKRIDVEDLFVDISNDLRVTPLEEENNLLEEYASKYGELPPFNGNFGGGSYRWDLYH